MKTANRTLGHLILIAAVAMLLTISAGLLVAHEGEPKGGEPYEGDGWNMGSGGLLPLDFPASGVHVLAWLPLSTFGNHTSANACAGYVSPSGREYGIIGLSKGTAFVDVTDPANPQVVGVVPGPTSSWRDMKVYQSYCYTVSEGGGGIQVIDLSQIDDGVLTNVGNVTEGGSVPTTATHTVALDEVSGYLYRCGGSGAGPGVTNGIRMYSLANPAAPVFVGEWHERYVHEAQVVTYTDGPYAGRQIAFLSANDQANGGNPRLDILDVTDKSNPFIVGEATYSWPAYAHQSWLTEDRHYAYLNDELAESKYGIPTTTRIIDVSDLANPFEAGTFTNGNSAIGHNLYIRGDRLFASNYRSGLRVWDISERLDPVEIGYFDTWPQDDDPAFNSLWDNYPFLPSGIVIGSDIEKGMFVWLIGDLPLKFSFPEGVPELISPAGDALVVRIEGKNGATVAPGSAKLHYDLHDGAGYVTVDLVPIAPGSDDYVAEFPSLQCASTVSFYVSAQSTGGEAPDLLLRDPPTAPAVGYSALVAVGTEVLFADDFDVNVGWVSGAPDDDATTGHWEWGDPVGTQAGGQQVQPSECFIGEFCWFTGQHTPGKGAGWNDVDHGKTTLFSPIFDLSGLDETAVSYQRWYSNHAGANPHHDIFEVDISPDGGESWVSLEVVGPDGPETMGGWYRAEFRISDFIALTDQVQVRFIASDYDPQALVEAAIDKFRIVSIDCTPPQPDCPADLTGDGSVGVGDLLALLAAWGPCPGGNACPADLDGDGSVGVSDLLLMLAAWGVCP